MTEMSYSTPATDPAQLAEKAEDIILRTEKISKVYPGTIALNDVDFNVYRGKVNVLVGENGAGKSTLMKILAGVEQPTSGHIYLEGNEIFNNSIVGAGKNGIGIIFQEMMVFPNLSVTENLFIGREKMTGAVISQREQRRETLEILKRMEQNINPDSLVGDLRVGQQQIIEIARAISENKRILIMDEPTSALSNDEVKVLFKLMRELLSQGVTIIYISHKLEELMQIGNYITVLRDGRKIEEAKVHEIDLSWIINKMVGDKKSQYPSRENVQIGEELMRVEDMTLPRLGGGYAVDHVNFCVNKGEILGLYGLVGAGRTELFECLCGYAKDAEGKITIHGRELTSKRIEDRIRDGIILVPEDRQGEGLVQTMSVGENIVLSSLSSYLSGFFLSSAKEKKAIDDKIREVKIKVANPNNLITSLSGGNQQKVVFSRALLTEPTILLLDEPTRGIDVGAKAEIFRIVSDLAEEGYGIIFVSTELKEVIAVSDRILVMSKGKITGEFTKENATEEALVTASAIGHELKGVEYA